MLFVFVSLIVCARFYKKMYPGIKLIRTELVLFPFRLKLFYFPIHMYVFSFKTPDVTEKHPRVSVGRTLSSNFVFTIWAVFGGFILHFLLCNFLTVLLRPRYEDPVDTIADLNERNITLILVPESEGWIKWFAASPDQNFQEISQTIVIAKDWDEYADLISKVISTGMYADMGTVPWAYEEDFDDWYRSSERVPGLLPYGFHLSNKKWPLKKVM